MKRLCLSLIVMLAVGAMRAATTTNAPVQQEIVINSGTGQFDGKTDWVVYTDHVRVDDPTMKLTCEWLTGNSPTTNDPGRHIIARTNVVVDLIADQGKKWHITCNQAVYDYHLLGTVTNETVTLTGNAVAQSDLDTISGQPLVYDLIAKKYWGVNFQMTHLLTNNSPHTLDSTTSKTNRAPVTPILP